MDSIDVTVKHGPAFLNWTVVWMVGYSLTKEQWSRSKLQVYAACFRHDESEVPQRPPTVDAKLAVNLIYWVETWSSLEYMDSIVLAYEYRKKRIEDIG